MRISLVQQQTTLDREANLEKGISALSEAAAGGAQIVAFAELSFQRFFPQFHISPDLETFAEPIPGPTTDRFCSLAKELGIVIVINLFEEAGGRTYDSSPHATGHAGSLDTG